jgi:hypothetical protein
MTRFDEVQLAFLLGFYCGCSSMRIELQHEAEETTNRLSKELRHEFDDTIDRLDAEVDAAMHAMQAKFARLQAISDTFETETDPARC